MFATIDRYVLREVAMSLAGVTVVLLAILVSYQIARILGIAADRGFPHEIVIALIGLTTLENLMVLVPISMLLATMLALGRLYHESEMAAVKACGIGPERLYLPVYTLALPVAVGLAWLTFMVGPDARNGAEELRGRGMRDAEFGLLTKRVVDLVGDQEQLPERRCDAMGEADRGLHVGSPRVFHKWLFL